MSDHELRDTKMNPFFRLSIPRRMSICYHGKEPLLAGMEVYSLLLEESVNQFTRRDYCAVCWGVAGRMAAKEKNACGFWKGVIEKKKKKEKETREDVVFSLLDQLLEEKENKSAEIYLLCLFLARARKMVLRREYKQNGLEYHVYEILKREEFLNVQVVAPSPDKIVEIQKMLAASVIGE